MHLESGKETEILNIKPTHSNFNIFVDFDSTLFDTKRFTAGLWTAVSARSGLPYEQVESDRPKFMTNPVLRDNNFFGHMDSYGLDPDESLQMIQQMVRDHDYLYPDSATFLRGLHTDGYKPRILSFGESHFQSAKIEPVLAKLTRQSETSTHIGYAVVFRKKGEHIAET